MSICKINTDLVKSCDFSIGGISKIYVLDQYNVQAYDFENDENYDHILLNYIYINNDSSWFEVQCNTGSTITEKYSNKIYTKDLTTIISDLHYTFQQELVNAVTNRYTVAARTYNGQWLVFCNATLTYTDASDTRGGNIGYTLSFENVDNMPMYYFNGDSYFSQTRFKSKGLYYPIYDSYACELTNGYRTGYKVALYALCKDADGNAIDSSGNLVSESKNKQAIMVLNGQSNPDSSKYEVTGTYTKEDTLSSGENVKITDTTLCVPNNPNGLVLSDSTLYITRNETSKNITVYSNAGWSYSSSEGRNTLTPSAGGTGSTSVSVGRTEYGNDVLTLTNNSSSISKTITIYNVCVSASSSSVSLGYSSSSYSLNVLCTGGTSQGYSANVTYSDSYNTGWCSVTTASSSLRINVEANNGDERKCSIVLVHSSDTDETFGITVTQAGTTEKKFTNPSKVIMTYYWESNSETGGTDLDTCTYISGSGVNTLDSIPIGFGQSGNSNTAVTQYISYGGDTKVSGKEIITLNASSLLALGKNCEIIGKGNFYGSLKSGYVNVKFEGYDSSNNLTNTFYVSKNITASGSCNYPSAITSYSSIFSIDVDTATSAFTIAKNYSTDGNQCTATPSTSRCDSFSCTTSAQTTVDNSVYSGCTDLSWKFYGCSYVSSISKDISSCIKANGMCYQMSNLKSVTLTNTNNLVNIENMFGYSSYLTSVTMGNIANVQDMQGTFTGCADLKYFVANMFGKSLTASTSTGLAADFSSTQWGMSSATSASLVSTLYTNSYDRLSNGMSEIYIGLNADAYVNIYKAGYLNKISNKGYILSGYCSSFSCGINADDDIQNGYFNCCPSLAGKFSGCSYVTYFDKQIDLCYTLESAFKGDTNLTGVVLENSSAVTNMSNTFSGCTKLQSLEFDGTSLKSFSGLQGCAALSGILISNLGAGADAGAIFDFSDTEWGEGTYQATLDETITNLYDRTSAGKTGTVYLKINSTIINNLTTDQKNTISAYGYTLS